MERPARHIESVLRRPSEPLVESRLALPRYRGVFKRCYAGSDFRLPGETKLYHFLARRSLPGARERLNQRTFPAHNHLRKAFEPFALRNFGVGREPIGELTELTGGNFPFSDSIEQMVQQSRRKVLPPNLRHFFVR